MSCLPFPAAGESHTSLPAVKLPPIGVQRNGINTCNNTQSIVCGVFLNVTYGGDEGCVEGVVREAEQHTGLPHARVSDQKQLEQQVVRLLRH